MDPSTGIAMDRSQVIAIITSASFHAREGLKLPHNAARTLGSPECTTDGDEGDSPERQGQKPATPSVAQLHDTQVVLTFNKPPKDRALGFICGRDPAKCDILLTAGGPESSVSGVHFCLDLNWSSGVLMLYDHSRYGTIVEISPFEKLPLNLSRCPVVYDVFVEAGLAKFHVRIPVRSASEQEAWLQNFHRARHEREMAVPTLALELNARGSTFANSADVSMTTPVGEGASSTVYHAVDGDGKVYAAKVFKRQRHNQVSFTSPVSKAA